MNADEFWNLVARVHEASNGDMDLKCEQLAEELRELGPNGARSFASHFYESSNGAYSWALWDAAYIINGGCSDDSFTDFRSTLISMGRQVFEAALMDPESLVDVDVGAGEPTYEGYQYVASKVYEELTHQELSLDIEHPAEPSGVQTAEWELEKRYPKLAAKFGHQDSNYNWQKDRAADESAEVRLADTVVELSLAGGIIPSCGLIPPFPALADILRKGISPENDHSWEPVELKEPAFWKAVMKFEELQPHARAARPDLKNTKLQLDLGASGAKTFEEWHASLKQRGLI
jgi:hypothetical protein